MNFTILGRSLLCVGFCPKVFVKQLYHKHRMFFTHQMYFFTDFLFVSKKMCKFAPI